MNKHWVWSRRRFSQALALSAAGSILFPSQSLPMIGAGTAGSDSLRGLALVGSTEGDSGEGAIHLFRVSGSDWQHLQTLPTAAPGHLLLHPSLPVLYVLHNVAEWNHLSRGAASAYRIDSEYKRVTLMGTEPLSLSATYPRHAVVSVDGRHLFIASGSGGTYNVLPISPDGSLMAVSGIRKECGREDNGHAKVARPEAVASHPDGTVLAIDSGQESLTCFHLTGNEPVVQQRTRVHEGYGARDFAVSPCGKHAYTLHGAGHTVAVLSLSPETLLQPVQIYTGLSRAQHVTMAPGGRFLLASNDRSTAVLRIDQDTGALSHHAQLEGTGQQLSFAAGNGHMLGFDGQTGAVRYTAFDTTSGRAASSSTVAHVDNAASLAFCAVGNERMFSL